jgi:hypothetical protein
MASLMVSRHSSSDAFGGDGDKRLHIIIRKKRKRQHGQGRNAWLFCYYMAVLQTTAMAPTMVTCEKSSMESTTGTTTTTTTPKNPFAHHPLTPVFWTETAAYFDDTTGDDGDDDDDDDSSVEDEFYESSSTWVPLEYATPFRPPEEAKKPTPINSKSKATKLQQRPIADDLHSQPLKTLEKLRQMLDDTDYMTARPDDPPCETDWPTSSASITNLGMHDDEERQQQPTTKPESSSASAAATTTTESQHQQQQHQRLWTSADRSKYKQQQKRLRQQNPPSSDDELSDIDDGLGYSLPNLPVYFSDAEGESDGEQEHQQQQQQHPPNQTTGVPPPPPPMSWHSQQQQQHYQTPPQQPPEHQGNVPLPSLQQHGGGPLRPPEQYPNPYHLLPYLHGIHNQQQVQQQYPNQQQQQPYPSAGQSQPMNTYQQYPQYPPPYFGPYNTGMQQPQHQQPHHQQQLQHQHPQHHHQQQLSHQQQLNLYAQQFAAWAAATGYAPPAPYGPAQPQSFVQPLPFGGGKTSTSGSPIYRQKAKQPPPPNQKIQQRQQQQQEQPEAPHAATTNEAMATASTITPTTLTSTTDVTAEVQPQLLQHFVPEKKTSTINFDSLQKLGLMAITATVACYASVSPRDLPSFDYNRLFYKIVRIVSLTLIAPMMSFLLVMDAAENDWNDIIQSFYASFSMGYILVFALEIVSTTLVRLFVFLIWEQDIFAQLLPRIPLVVLPWVLREHKYRPKRITLLAADFLTSCVAAPVLEEYIKLKLLQWTTRLPRNYLWTKKPMPSNKRKTVRKREKVVPELGNKEVTNINKYMAQMLAVSIGLKLADAGRRVLMYTKDHHADKSFYAIFRGLYPIQELCGTMTALGLAKRDVLGAEISTWWILLPAVVVHGMANFRGMKPIFKWNSATPWSEMQLYPWSTGIQATTMSQFTSKAFPKVMWLVIMFRALGYCVKNYYYTNRQAEKRTTTYAGNPCAIDAALASSDYLKKTHGK